MIRFCLGVFLLLGVLLQNGCAMERTTAESSVVDSYATPDDELDFLDALERRRVVTNHDAIHALLMAAEPEAHEDLPTDYESRVNRARQRGWVKEDAELPPNESATVGMIAVAVCDMLEIKGGLTMRVFGPSPRYATRELIFRQILPRRTDNQSMTGLEFIDLLSRVQERMEVIRAQRAREAREVEEENRAATEVAPADEAT
ncbi:MAG: hypothetical protein EA377_03930 [Phycisphaerales bacterium]|nr:MAG: hypothetical protein EA377_03930 [Phycisphaerales bacterium]